MHQYEMMFDLETLDTIPSAVVLSIGAVVWANSYKEGLDERQWHLVDSFHRILDFEDQLLYRTVSASTLMWWMQQGDEAKAEAFGPDRTPVDEALMKMKAIANTWNIDHFWANPATFDFPIWEDLAGGLDGVPWTYRQRHDVRTLIDEASYSVRDHKLDPAVQGVPHAPVYDCLYQIDILTAARNKLHRK